MKTNIKVHVKTPISGCWVRLRLRESIKRGRRIGARVMSPSTKENHVILDRPLNGKHEHHIDTLEVITYE